MQCKESILRGSHFLTKHLSSIGSIQNSNLIDLIFPTSKMGAMRLRLEGSLAADVVLFGKIR